MTASVEQRPFCLYEKGDGSKLARKTQLYEYSLQASRGEDRLRVMAAVLAQFGKAVRKDIAAATEIGDATTINVLTGISRETDRELWLVEAHLQGG